MEGERLPETMEVCDAMTLMDEPSAPGTVVLVGGHYVCASGHPATFYKGQQFPTSCFKCDLELEEVQPQSEAHWWFRLFDVRQWPRPEAS
jgi:hypothetical protein